MPKSGIDKTIVIWYINIPFMRANIYSVKPLPEERTESIHAGLDQVSDAIGKNIEAKSLLTRVPLLLNGRVNPKKVGYGKLDRWTLFHIFAVPLELPNPDTLGMALESSGVSYVDPFKTNTRKLSRTTAHEVVHSLGFVLENSEQIDPSDHHHCSDAGCLMHKQLNDGSEMSITPISSIRVGERVTRAQFGLPTDDFCVPCKTDLDNFGRQHARSIMLDRLLLGSIVPRTIAYDI